MFSNRSNKMLTIPPLLSGGIMLSYRCSNRCRHCLYRCSPQRPDDWMSVETAERVFSALAKESRLDSVHLAGGEATLRFDLLCDVIKLACAMRIPLAYLETNAAWCSDQAVTREKLERLHKVGLRAILVSSSMFHNEFVPLTRTRTCIEEASAVFGSHNVIVWLPHLYQMLAQIPGEHDTHTLEEFCSCAGIAPDSPDIPRLYHVIPGGRAPEALRKCYTVRPAQAFHRENCRADLLNTSHFHIDVYENLFTGLCAGIAPGKIDNLHPTLTSRDYPVAHTLCETGPCGLLETAASEHGFRPRQDGYASKCDLCYDVRRYLYQMGRFSELSPGDYYTD